MENPDHKIPAMFLRALRDREDVEAIPQALADGFEVSGQWHRGESIKFTRNNWVVWQAGPISAPWNRARKVQERGLVMRCVDQSGHATLAEALAGCR